MIVGTAFSFFHLIYILWKCDAFFFFHDLICWCFKKTKQRQNYYKLCYQILWGKCFQNIVSYLLLNSCLSFSFSRCLLFCTELQNMLSARQDDLLTSRQKPCSEPLPSPGMRGCTGSLRTVFLPRSRTQIPPDFLNHTKVNSPGKVHFILIYSFK